jgi:hypothetical protein
MTLLLDTHIAVWAITGDGTLGEDFLDRLRHDPDIFLSRSACGRSPSSRPPESSPDRPTSPSGYATWASANCP